jgi:hypothetical protein
MSKADLLVERGAERLEDLSRKAAAKGGLAAKLADELAEDAAFLRKLKPSLIKARAKGRAGHAPIARASDRDPQAPSGPQVAAPGRKKAKPKSRQRGRGPNPFLVAGVALAAGIALANLIDWRGHAHPRD